MAQAAGGATTYDWVAAEGRWEGLFRDALKKLLRQVHATINIDDEAVNLMDRFMYSLLAHFCFINGDVPATIEECQQVSARLIPDGIAEYMEKEAIEIHDNYMQTKSKKSIRTEFPVMVVYERLKRRVTKKAQLEFPAVLCVASEH